MQMKLADDQAEEKVVEEEAEKLAEAVEAYVTLEERGASEEEKEEAHQYILRVEAKIEDVHNKAAAKRQAVLDEQFHARLAMKGTMKKHQKSANIQDPGSDMERVFKALVSLEKDNMEARPPHPTLNCCLNPASN